MIDYFEKGREHYNKKEYKEAVACFIDSIAIHYSNGSRAWLGNCYECGFGVKKDLVLAKDLYQVCYGNLGSNEAKSEFGTWVASRLEALIDISTCDSGSTYINGIGNVKVMKYINAYHIPQIRYNNDEVVVIIDKRTSIVEGFHYAEKQIPEINKNWTCDGESRYYDNYTLKTDFFYLEIRRGNTERYITRIEDDKCTLLFPKHANLEYIYVQKTIHKKVKELLYERAKVVIPYILQKVSERINVPYGKLRIEKSSLGNYAAYNYGSQHDITFCAACVQLPEKSLESLCIHELTHNFVLEHNKAFYDKLKELGGEEAYNLDQTRWKEGKWKYIIF